MSSRYNLPQVIWQLHREIDNAIQHDQHPQNVGALTFEHLQALHDKLQSARNLVETEMYKYE